LRCTLAIRPSARTQRIDGDVLNREIAGLDVDEQGAREIEPADQRRLADAGRTNDQRLRASRGRCAVSGWTKEGLLRPRGERNPGTGRKRSYSEAAIIDALILTALSDWGIPAVKAAQYGSVEQKMLTSGREAVAEARKRQPEVVSLVIARVSGKSRVSSQQVFIQFGSKPLSEHFESAITLNITRMLERIPRIPATAALSLTTTAPIVSVTTHKKGE
jgi:hypothetical protein